LILRGTEERRIDRRAGKHRSPLLGKRPCRRIQGGDETGKPEQLLWLDLELADSYSELGESWIEDIASTTVVDGWAIWCVNADSSVDAARWDIDFPNGTNVCEGYGDTATLMTSTFATRDEHSYWDEAPYSFQWTEGSSPYQGCSAAANGE